MADLPSGTVTFLFTDIEGSTRRWEQYPGPMADALAVHDAIVRNEVARHAGAVVSTMGDGFLVVFASAAKAVACALGIQRSLDHATWPSETGPLRVRMGLHTAEGVLRDGQYLNQPLNRCARVMGAAHGGQVVLSESTAALVRRDLPPDAALLDLGEHSFRDVADAINVFQLDHPALVSSFPPLRTVVSSIGTLPVQLTSFVGRRRELADIAAALDSARLVTLTGPGGVGKTRLAIEAAHAHPLVAKWFVDLVSAEPDDVVASIATTLAVTDRPGVSLEQAVHEALSAQPALVVLDNCEHVLDVAAEVTRRLLTACAGTVVLATSREALGAPGERMVAVRPLDVGDDDDGAVALFAARAEDAGSLVGPEDRVVISEICTRVDGMPLAIELAAARCATLGVDGVLEALGDRLLHLARTRGPDERHRSLRAVLDWSHSLLDDEEQVALRRVAVFHGSFGLKDAAALAGDGIAASALSDAVPRLVAKSLIVHGRDASRASTYRLLETVRAYGIEKLEEAGEAEIIRERHLARAIEVAGAIERELEANDAADPALDAVFDNLRAALTWAVDRDRRVDVHLLARRLGHVAYGRRFVSEAQLRYQQAADYAADDSEAALDLLDAGHAAFAILQGDLGFGCYLDAAERAERAGDNGTAALALAMAAERGNRFRAEFGAPPARSMLKGLLARAHTLGDDAGDDRLAAQLVVADAWLSVDRDATATVPAAQAAVDAARRVGDVLLESSALDALGAAERDAHHIARSAEVCTERLALLGRLLMHDPRTGSEQLDILHMASDALLARGDLRGALAVARDWASHPIVAGASHVTTRGLVVALCLTGDFDEAAEEAHVMRLAWERLGGPVAGWMAPAVYLAALAHGLRAERDAFGSWWDLAEKVCLSPGHAVRAFVLIRLALHEGRLDDAETEVDYYRSLTSTAGSDSPWSDSTLDYGGYLWAAVAEVWAARHAPDVGARLAEMQVAFAEHLWAVPTLLRAQWRSTGDLSRLHAAVDGFAAIGARFEEAATRALLPGPDGENGRERLTALRCSFTAPT